MADEIVTREQLENASKDAASLGQFINGSDIEDVLTRLGEQYPTLAKAIRIIQEEGAEAAINLQNAGGYIAVANLAILQTITPSYNYQLARVQDTGDEYFWDITATPTAVWKPTGKNWLTESKKYTDQKLDGVIFDSEDDFNWLYAVVDQAGQVLFGMDLNKIMQFPVLQASKLQTSGTSIEEITETDIFNILDKDNNKIVAIDQNLLAKFVSIFAGQLSVKDMSVETLSTTDNPVTIVDKDGYIIGALQPDGIYNSIGSTSSGLVGIQPEPRIYTNYIHISGQGQSLKLGLGSGSQISVASEAPNALVPNAGIEDGNWTSVEGIAGLPLSSTGLVPFDPALNPNKTESPLYAAMIHLQKSLDERSVETQVLGSTNAHGGAPIASLSKGTGIYAAGVAQSQAYRNYASAAGKSCLTQFVIWMQGESDISQGLSGNEYLNRLNKLIADYQADIGQDLAPIMLTYQTGSHTRRSPYFSPDIPHAQLKASNINRSIKMCCATYVMPYNGGTDGVHMPANSYRWLGSYFGKVMDWMLLNNRVDWKPVQPEKIIRNNRVVTIKFHVPVKPLVFDTTLVTDPGNYGFKVFDNSSVEQTIESVSIVNEDTVKIVLSSTPSTNVTVKYAQGVNWAIAGPTTGARGNLRDSDPSVSKVLDITTGQPFPLQNWCPIFSLEEGFSWVQ